MRKPILPLLFPLSRSTGDVGETKPIEQPSHSNAQYPVLLSLAILIFL
jgi:hypothetical protein